MLINNVLGKEDLLASCILLELMSTPGDSCLSRSSLYKYLSSLAKVALKIVMKQGTFFLNLWIFKSKYGLSVQVKDFIQDYCNRRNRLNSTLLNSAVGEVS